MTGLPTRILGIDLRSLAVLRMGLGLLLLADLAVRATDLQAHYTDAGVLPRAVLASRYEHTCVWSIHMLTGSFLGQAALFALAATAALALLFGMFSRTAALLSWVLLVSLHARNPLITNGGDVLLRSLLFWGIFLPLDGRWALRPMAGRPWRRGTVVSVASAAMLIQIALMYWASGYYKWHGVWRSANGLQEILSTDSYAKPLAYVLLAHPRLLTWLSGAALWSELVLPWLIFSPLGTKSVRVLAIVWFGLFHLGIQLTLTVGWFAYTCWLAWILFLPSEVWDRLAPWSAQFAASAAAVVEGLSRTQNAARWPRMVVHSALCVLLAYIVLFNATHLPDAWTSGIMPRSWTCVADLLACRQRWNLFQNPVRDDGWYIVAARLDDDRVIDLLRDGAAADWESYRKPKYAYARFPNHRWRKYYRNLVSDRASVYREPLLRYLATQWQRAHTRQGRIATVELQYMQELGGDVGEENRFQQRFLQTLVLGQKAE